jgi:hypothetical protein
LGQKSQFFGENIYKIITMAPAQSQSDTLPLFHENLIFASGFCEDRRHPKVSRCSEVWKKLRRVSAGRQWTGETFFKFHENKYSLVNFMLKCQISLGPPKQFVTKWVCLHLDSF